MVFRELLSNTKNKQRSVDMIRTLKLQEYLRKEFLTREKEIKENISDSKKQKKEMKKLDKIYAKKMKLAKKIFPLRDELERLLKEDDEE